jgi:hypothetical protein
MGRKTKTKDDTKKVSETHEEEEVWDLVRVIPKKEKVICRTEGCKEQAVATWASNLEPDEKWNLCEDCQLKDFGGWPEGTEPDQGEEEGDDQKDETTTNETPADTTEQMSSEQASISAEESTDKVACDAKVDDRSDGTPMVVDEPVMEDKKAEASSEEPPSAIDASTTPSTNATKERSPAAAPMATQTQDKASTPPSTDATKEPSSPAAPTVTQTQDEATQASQEPSSPAAPVVTQTQEEATQASKENSSPAAPLVTQTQDEATQASKEPLSPATPMVTQTQDEATQEDADEAEEVETWDLKKILSFQDITKEGTVKCSNEDCKLPACSVWISNLAPTTKWYYCVDCQENDFEGWPPLEEFPANYRDSMEPEHLQAIANKCSKQKDPVMPMFSSVSSSPSRKTSDADANFVTPPPNTLGVKASKVGSSKGAAKITPNPSDPKPTKPSAGALAMHKKWQEAAEAIGGKDARIVVSKPAAKKFIFDLLFDAFCPMNITQIFKVSSLFIVYVQLVLKVKPHSHYPCASGVEGRGSVACPECLSSRYGSGQA